ncbi:MAG: hypothetical protein ACK5PG_04705 [Lysobacterales bacterium]|jgi:hypothetical protein
MTLLYRSAALMMAFATAPVFAQSVQVQRSIPYAEDADIQNKVRTECTQLNTQLAEFTQEFGRENGIEVQLVETLDTSAEGRVLQMEIVDAVSMGNAFIGHQKYSRVRGVLFENGQQIADFRGRRNSMGGAFAGYKGSCSVLGRTVKALGKDIAQWLANPQDGAQLGD